jgi:hypothetical protein
MSSAELRSLAACGVGELVLVEIGEAKRARASARERLGGVLDSLVEQSFLDMVSGVVEGIGPGLQAGTARGVLDTRLRAAVATVTLDVSSQLVGQLDRQLRLETSIEIERWLELGVTVDRLVEELRLQLEPEPEPLVAQLVDAWSQQQRLRVLDIRPAELEEERLRACFELGQLSMALPLSELCAAWSQPPWEQLLVAAEPPAALASWMRTVGSFVLEAKAERTRAAVSRWVEARFDQHEELLLRFLHALSGPRVRP